MILKKFEKSFQTLNYKMVQLRICPTFWKTFLHKTLNTLLCIDQQTATVFIMSKATGMAMEQKVSDDDVGLQAESTSDLNLRTAEPGPSNAKKELHHNCISICT